MFFVFLKIQNDVQNAPFSDIPKCIQPISIPLPHTMVCNVKINKHLSSNGMLHLLNVSFVYIACHFIRQSTGFNIISLILSISPLF